MDFGVVYCFEFHLTTMFVNKHIIRCAKSATCFFKHVVCKLTKKVYVLKSQHDDK